ncbi:MULTISPECIES: hypothetical protein [Gordonibacter]|uniref:Uncharacterized protein n=1 Tax=Gordonibacter faecis TaxID=3047475 RepID=A0ABT7DL68_9ACTN|nr:MULTISPECIES: hypothetical protein [unclassified Gordonibacter]MDJ1650273.1 hypothetical protein [Gordonibacter sp. KGMB12511]HIW76881.1 hypothetical protein [Candidatus Gordonibacter avicola]
MSEQARRLRRAAVVLGVLLVIALVLHVVGALGAPSVLAEASHVIATEVGETYGSPALPAGFEDEVLCAASFEDVRVSPEGSVVGFTARGTPAEAFKQVEGLMRDHGWTVVPGGDGASGSFLKEVGQYRWAFVGCVRVGDTTSVVVQCAADDGKG